MQPSANPSLRPSFALAFVAFVLAPSAMAQWTVTSLNPNTGIGSTSKGGNASQQAGVVYTAPGVTHAGFWSNTAASFVDLHPAGMALSTAVAADGGRQFGQVDSGNGNPHVTLWSGTAGSGIDLHPAGSAYSLAYGAGGGQQVGLIDVAGFFHAGLWSGTAGSFVNLNPVGAFNSVAFSAAAGKQVGEAFLPAGVHAVLWSGTAASVVDLHPAGSNQSQGFGLDANQQVGRIMFNSIAHAGMWSGTAASYVDLHPAWAASSEANAVDAGEQVGEANLPFDYFHATIWNGTAASAFDLSALLGNEFLQSNSYATAIWHSSGSTYVLGYAFNSTLGRDEVLLWRRLPMTTYCVAKLNSVGCTPSISGFGTSSATAPIGFNVRSDNMQNNKVGLLLYGSSGRAATPFSGGFLCLSGPVRRSSSVNSGGSPAPANNCTGVFQLDMNAFRAGSLGGTPATFLSVPGTLVNSQFWGRDSGYAAPNNTQLSNALEFEVGP